MKKKNKSQINGILSPFLQKMRIKNAKPFLKGKKFLDIGCSLGEIIPFLPKGAEYVGVEGNKAYFENAVNFNPSYKFINAYLTGSNMHSFGFEKFDVIIALAVIEHIDNPKFLLAELKKHISKGGLIIISTPSKFADFILKAGSFLGIFMNEMGEHKELFTKKSLIMLARNAGFKIKKVKSFEFGLNYLMILSID